MAIRSTLKRSGLNCVRACTVGTPARSSESTSITASSQKKRKLAPFAVQPTRESTPSSASASACDPPLQHTSTLYEYHSLSAQARSSPSSSPLHITPSIDTPSDAPSPASSNTTATATFSYGGRGSTPPRFIPPHLHDEVLPSREASEAGGGPGAFDTEMSEGEHGAAEQRPNQVSAGRAIGGGRSVSPAKRRADDMEGSGGEQAKPPGSFPTEQEDTRSQWDVEMKELASQDGAESQVTVTNSLANSRLSTNSVNTSATSLDTEPPPPYSKEDNGDQSSKMPVFSTEEYDQQYAHVLQLANKELDEGTRGVIVSRRWLDRVRSRSTQGLTSKKYPKEAREGPVGPLDNSDLLPEDAFTEPHLQDAEGARFVPLKPGLAIEDDYQPLPMEAYDYICTTYGSKHPHSIRRYAHNTAPPEATQPNIQYETYPPVITIRKVPQPGSDSTKHTKALEALKARKDLAHRGQKSSDDAPRLVSSKSEKYQKFLRRAKEAAGIPIATKVKVWRVNKADDVSVDRPDSKQPGVLSPPASRDASPDNSAAVKLVVSPQTFSKMEVGVELEATEGKDETNNDKYNGRSTMELVGLFEDSTIILEEQTGGPGGGEFQSDNKKPKSSFLAAKGRGSTPASTTASGRTSPAPGMVTRGRARKDGKTRGVTGLTNLGNTCYMNSALQCIRSVEELAIYFLTKKFKSDINDDNPLGYHGAMAHAYANVLEGIYGSGSTSTFSPNEFKRKLGTYQPMFSGYGQQDSQEFLSFLVDALHEDLNRIRKKPYIENPDSDDARVHDAEYIVELGEIYRNNHRQRNDSIAMDLFSGFYKNTMECPTCDKVSVTFDPYSLVTVQLPMEITLQHNITYVPLHGKPVIHELDVDKNWTIKALKDHLAKKHAGASANAMWMAEVYNHQIFKVFDDASTIAETNIQSNDFIWIYELEQAPKNNPKKVHQTSLFSRDKINIVPEEGMDSAKADVFTVPIFNRTKSGQSQLFSKALHPLYITLTREEAKDYEIILKKVLIAVANITSRPILTEFDEELKSTEESGSIEEVDAENDTNSAEDAAGVSDHSAQSEEGYVNVSLDKSSQDTEMTNGGHEVAKEMCDEETPIPAKFMDPRYVIPQALRSHLFEAKYVPASNDNMFLAGSSGYTDGNLSPMLTRVKRPSRRSSVQSSSSDESSTSSASQAQTEDATDDSDSNGIDDKPDLVLGDSNEQSNDQVEESDDELAGPTNNAEIMEPSPVDGNHRSNRRANKRNRGRGKGKRGKGRNRNGPVTYSKQDKARYGQTRGVGGQFAAKRLQDEDSPYYIQIGEGIVLDWRPEAFDSLFEGDGNVADDMRGHRYVDDNGKQGRIFPDPEQDAKRQKREQRKKHGVDLDDCFDVTRRREILSEGNEWYCNRCKEMRQAAKTLEIWTLPDILVVHLKRFGGNRSFRDKIDLLVDYPVEGLDMNDKVGLKEGDKDYTYDLFAVDLHFGGLGGGHYTAYVKNFFDGEWYDCNDSSVYKLGSTHKIQSAAAYLLFYRRRSDKPLGPQALQDLVEEYRNPPTSAEEADDEDSGEGRLGGPSRSSPHGSPSVSAGAEAGAKSHLKGLNGSGGAGRASSLTTRATETTDLSGMNDGGWSFDGLKQPDEAGTLLDQMQDDNASTTAEMDDRDSALGSLISDGDTYNTGVNNSPIGATFVDVNAMDAADDPDTAIISLDENSHDKMD
ncbi:uncharacterized protein MYCFIDRAFT_214678 [Pseudocercospora fijiensis CIRAD86]|uniref:ubiquitinyl hydrolase 1 n=1 Tax=Pseudocercospora fijiensis (strain CIRAD86) TaxID=383855 RepID=M2Z378_PSEFD|nr:uncharacterized protein MYCFIDRAFT_214678 [Pseudocercospora fijiensis CIRAD86]EME84270.1 hypothetical protein MYCFIDRAFT_214678 [Pseudocercospora fijiensis CIRAD86]